MAAYRRVYNLVTCMLTAKNRDQLRNPTLGNRVWATFFKMFETSSGYGVPKLFEAVDHREIYEKN